MTNQNDSNLITAADAGNLLLKVTLANGSSHLTLAASPAQAFRQVADSLGLTGSWSEIKVYDDEDGDPEAQISISTKHLGVWKMHCNVPKVIR